MWAILVAAGAVGCAVIAVSVRRLLVSALWLAGASALTALLLYLLGAPEIAAIELSVGAGLVTVLFVFAINIAGEEPIEKKSVVPRWLAGGIILAAVGLLAFMDLPRLTMGLPEMAGNDFMLNFWTNRRLDMLLQLILIFAGVMAVVGLLSEDPAKREHKEEGK